MTQCLWPSTRRLPWVSPYNDVGNAASQLQRCRLSPQASPLLLPPLRRVSSALGTTARIHTLRLVHTWRGNMHWCSVTATDVELDGRRHTLAEDQTIGDQCHLTAKARTFPSFVLFTVQQMSHSQTSKLKNGVFSYLWSCLIISNIVVINSC